MLETSNVGKDLVTNSNPFYVDLCAGLDALHAIKSYMDSLITTYNQRIGLFYPGDDVVDSLLAHFGQCHRTS
ncbi:hypothetical protein Lal_00024187 [Lupinus albus]|nr:hypothetical protein Lal_00024187 [Lupinus albus]